MLLALPGKDQHPSCFLSLCFCEYIFSLKATYFQRCRILTKEVLTERNYAENSNHFGWATSAGPLWLGRLATNFPASGHVVLHLQLMDAGREERMRGVGLNIEQKGEGCNEVSAIGQTKRRSSHRAEQRNALFGRSLPVVKAGGFSEELIEAVN